MLLLLADAATEARDITRYQLGMVFIGVVVIVLMLLFRRIFKEDPGPTNKGPPPPKG